MKRNQLRFMAAFMAAGLVFAQTPTVLAADNTAVPVENDAGTPQDPDTTVTPDTTQAPDATTTPDTTQEPDATVI